MDSWTLTSQEAGRVEVHIEGAIDLANSRDLAEFLEMLIHSADRLEVNLADVGFVDSNGLAALLTAHRKAEERGSELVLVSPNERVQRLLDLTGCTAIFTVVVDAPEEFAAD